MYWQSGRAFKTAARVSPSVTLAHTHTPLHTHAPLPLSFLASDSRHPAMTRGLFLAACKAALNRQKYLFWQTDRPSPSTTCMQLSLSLPHLFPTLWFDIPYAILSPLWAVFPSFFLSYHTLYWFATPASMRLCSAFHGQRGGKGRFGSSWAHCQPPLNQPAQVQLFASFICSYFFSLENLFSISLSV